MAAMQLRLVDNLVNTELESWADAAVGVSLIRIQRLDQSVDQRLTPNSWVGHISHAPPQFLLRSPSSVSYSVVEQLVLLNAAMVYEQHLSIDQAVSTHSRIIEIEGEPLHVTALEPTQSGAELAQQLSGNILAIGAESFGRFSQHPDTIDLS